MKLVITGSLGHISRPLTEELIQKGHSVTVISSDPGRKKDIEALGAAAAIGTMEDADFLTAAFTGADAVYCMVAASPNSYFTPGFDVLKHYREIGHNYARAIERSGVKRVVNLSTIGAHLEKGSGILLGAHDLAITLDKLSPEVSITHMRPVAFYYNLYGFMDMIKKEGVMAANYGGTKVPWVSPLDIATAVAEEITAPFTGRKIRYVASEELTGNEVAGILGAAIGKPDMKWMVISDEQMRDGLEAKGMIPQVAAGMTEMYSSLQSGLLSEHYYGNRPAVMGKKKMKDFAKEFAIVFNQK